MPIKPKSTRPVYAKEKEPHARRNKPNVKFYSSKDWRNLRKMVLNNNPFCVHCEKEGRLNPAQVVDHIIPINEGGSKLDQRNLQGLCHRCHNSKSGKEAHKLY